MPLKVEEIEKSLAGAKDEIERIKLMNSHGYELLRQDAEYALELTERAIALSRKLNYRLGIALGLANKGFYNFFKVGDKEALPYMEEAEQILRKIPFNEREGFARVLNGLGCVHMNMGEHSTAALYLREALNLAEEGGDMALVGKIYTNLSFIHESLHQYEQSLEYSKKATRLLEKSTDYTGCAIALNNIADTCYKLGRYEEALNYLKRAEKLIEERDIIQLSGMVQLTMGEIYQQLGRMEEAEESLLKADHLNKLYSESSLNTKTIYQLGKLYKEMGERKRALNYLRSAYKAAEESSAIYIQQNICKAIYELYYESGNYKMALRYFEQYYNFKEKDFSLEMEKNLRNVEAESLKRVNERIKVISAIGREITATLDLRLLLKTIYRSVNSLLDAYNFGIAGYDSATGRISYNMYVEKKGYLPDTSYSVDKRDTLAAYAIRERADIFMNDAPNEYRNYVDRKKPLYVRMEGEDEDADDVSKSIMVTPLIVSDEVVGVVSVQSHKKGAYTSNDLDTLKALASYIAIALNNARQAEMIKRKNEELKRLAITDYLTGIYNRREFEKRVRAFWNITARQRHYFSIIILDADFFKKINDTYGHPAGDECLKQLAALLKSNISSPDDCLARYGGEEFIILLNSPAEVALEMAERIRRQTEELSIKFEELTFKMTVSIGISTALVSTISAERGPELLISKADEALYRSKEEGRNRVTFLPLQ